MSDKALNLIALAFFSAIVLFGFLFVRSCNDGFGYQAGSGLGSLVDIGEEKYQSEFLKKYADTFLMVYPQYRPPLIDHNPAADPANDFLHLTDIYFATYPRERYSVQWQGTGFISVRFAYDYEVGVSIVENERVNSFVDSSVRARMTKRLRSEVLDKIDSIIAQSEDSVRALRLPTF